MHICFTLSSLSGGGAERVATSLSNQFVKIGHKVTLILVSIDRNNNFFELDNRIEIIPLLKNCNAKNFLKRKKILRKKIKEVAPDVVISFLPHVIIYTYFAMRGLKIPLICSERNDPHQYNKFRRFLLKKAMRKSAGCVFQTDDARKYYFKNNDSKGIIINNPVFVKEVDSSLLAEPKLNQFISVGRLVRQKNFGLLIEAFSDFCKEHKDYKLIIYGEGPLRKELEILISDFNLNNNVFLPGPDIDWHEKAVLSKGFISSSNFEGMPNCLEEALCLGIPCIATNCPIGGSRTLINLLGNGYLVPVCDKKAIVDSMIKIDNGELTFKVPDYSSFLVENIASIWIDYISTVLK